MSPNDRYSMRNLSFLSLLKELIKTKQWLMTFALRRLNLHYQSEYIHRAVFQLRITKIPLISLFFKFCFLLKKKLPKLNSSTLPITKLSIPLDICMCQWNITICKWCKVDNIEIQNFKHEIIKDLPFFRNLLHALHIFRSLEYIWYIKLIHLSISKSISYCSITDPFHTL